MREAVDLARVWSDPGIVAVVELVSRRMGLSFPPGRMASVEQLLHRARFEAGMGDWESFRRLLMTDTDAFDRLAGALTVNESYFFRDQAQFDLIRTVLLPRLASEPGPIRLWSAGCAAGQEPFTLAILCDQMGIADRCRIVGTDIAPRRLAAAARGRFARWSLRGVSPEIVQRYFRPVDVRFEIKPSIRSRVEFRQMNFADRAAWASAPAPADILLCRNVLIYFDEAAVEATARQLIASLSERGYLLVGASDPPISDYVDCAVEITPAGLVYRKPNARRHPPSPQPIAEDVNASVGGVDVSQDTETPRPRPVTHPSESARPTPTAAGVRALADAGQIQAAIDACVEALRVHPTSIDLRYLHALLLSQAGRHAESAAAARRALYLDRSLILGHAALGIALAQLGDRAGAVRSLTTARDLLAPLSDDEALVAGGGETASRVRASVTAHLDLLDR